MNESWSVQKKSDSSGMWQTYFWEEPHSEEMTRKVFKIAIESYPKLKFRLVKHCSDMQVFDEHP